jgi:hypothetical protein
MFHVPNVHGPAAYRHGQNMLALTDVANFHQYHKLVYGAFEKE